ncbi:GNAT family N-acetyltransferase [Devosia sp. A8/3-2]|nr:GNAT family N-acetyltransferase [Devosia sp. A8/3-2]
MSLIIRRATPADIPVMSVVLTASITELCVADHGGKPHAIAARTRNKSEAGVAAMLANPEQDFYVAERDGAVLAVGAVSRDGKITLNYVAPKALFRRQQGHAGASGSCTGRTGA